VQQYSLESQDSRLCYLTSSEVKSLLIFLYDFSDVFFIYVSHIVKRNVLLYYNEGIVQYPVLF